MHSPEEREEIIKKYEALLPKLKSPEVQARMIADGLDPEAEFKKTKAAMDTYLAATEATDKALENQLQAEADVADASYEGYKGLRLAVAEYKQANPLDPRLEEWEDFLEAWAEQVPKEPL